MYTYVHIKCNSIVAAITAVKSYIHRERVRIRKREREWHLSLHVEVSREGLTTAGDGKEKTVVGSFPHQEGSWPWLGVRSFLAPRLSRRSSLWERRGSLRTRSHRFNCTEHPTALSSRSANDLWISRESDFCRAILSSSFTGKDKSRIIVKDKSSRINRVSFWFRGAIWRSLFSRTMPCTSTTPCITFFFWK